MRYQFIYAHLDDETIISYGTTLQLARNLNNAIDITILCGNGRRQQESNKRIDAFNHNIQCLKNETGNKNITVTMYYEWDLELTQQQVQKLVHTAISDYKPDIIFTHSNKDNHFEHRLIADQVLVEARCVPGITIRRVLAGVTPNISQTYGQHGAFVPNVFYDISNYLMTCKNFALNEYVVSGVLPLNGNDIRSPQAVTAMNSYYGKTIGVEYAEAFELIFEVN